MPLTQSTFYGILSGLSYAPPAAEAGKAVAAAVAVAPAATPAAAPAAVATVSSSPVSTLLSMEEEEMSADQIQCRSGQQGHATMDTQTCPVNMLVRVAKDDL